MARVSGQRSGSPNCSSIPARRRIVDPSGFGSLRTGLTSSSPCSSIPPLATGPLPPLPFPGDRTLAAVLGTLALNLQRTVGDPGRLHGLAAHGTGSHRRGRRPARRRRRRRGRRPVGRPRAQRPEHRRRAGSGGNPGVRWRRFGTVAASRRYGTAAQTIVASARRAASPSRASIRPGGSSNWATAPSAAASTTRSPRSPPPSPTRSPGTSTSPTTTCAPPVCRCPRRGRPDGRAGRRRRAGGRVPGRRQAGGRRRLRGAVRRPPPTRTRSAHAFAACDGRVAVGPGAGRGVHHRQRVPRARRQRPGHRGEPPRPRPRRRRWPATPSAV